MNAIIQTFFLPLHEQVKKDNINMTKANKIIIVLCRGIGQVMFQNNALSGMLMLAGILISSWQMALLAVAGNAISTLTAKLSGYSSDDIANGLYGFNGTLTGIAVGVFMPLTPVTLLIMAAASCLSTWITRLFSRQTLLPGMTAPFILAVWLMLGICHMVSPSILLASGTPAAEASTDILKAFSLNIGQVMFQGNTVWTGLLFLVGILVNSRVSSLYTITGALLSLPPALIAGAEPSQINAGLTGYNAVLCAIALGGTTWKSGMWACLAIALSVVIQLAGLSAGITTLTAPFVVSVWIVILLRKLGKKNA